MFFRWGLLIDIETAAKVTGTRTVLRPDGTAASTTTFTATQRGGAPIRAVHLHHRFNFPKKFSEWRDNTS